MAASSNDLLWLLLKNHNSFLVNHDGVTFSREPGNLTNKNTRSSSGLANRRAVDIKASDAGVVLRLKSKKPSHRSKPAKTFHSVTLNKNEFQRTAKTITSTVGRFYRSDLKRSALKRWSKIYLSQKGVAKKPKAKRARRNKN